MFKVIKKNCNDSQNPLIVYSENVMGGLINYHYTHFLFYINREWVWKSAEDYEPFIE